MARSPGPAAWPGTVTGTAHVHPGLSQPATTVGVASVPPGRAQQPGQLTQTPSGAKGLSGFTPSPAAGDFNTPDPQWDVSDLPVVGAGGGDLPLKSHKEKPLTAEEVRHTKSIFSLEQLVCARKSGGFGVRTGVLDEATKELEEEAKAKAGERERSEATQRAIDLYASQSIDALEGLLVNKIVTGGELTPLRAVIAAKKKGEAVKQAEKRERVPDSGPPKVPEPSKVETSGGVPASRREDRHRQREATPGGETSPLKVAKPDSEEELEHLLFSPQRKCLVGLCYT